MRKLSTIISFISSVVLFMLCGGVIGYAQQTIPPSFAAQHQFTDTTPQNWINIKERGIRFHQIFAWPDATGVTTCQYKLEYSNDGISAAGDIISNQSCTSAGATDLTAATSANFVRINPTTKTGSGRVRSMYVGWVNQSITATVSGTVNQGTPGMTPWPVDITTITASPSGEQLPANSNASIFAYHTLKSGLTASAMTGTTSTQVIAATASNYTYADSCTLSNAHASVDTYIILQDGSGGTTLWEGLVVHLQPPVTVTFPHPIKTSIGVGLYAANVTTGSSTIVACSGFVSPVSY